MSFYNSTGVPQYYYGALAYYYYYLASCNGDYAGYYYDSYACKSTNYRGRILTRATTAIIMLTTVITGPVFKQ